MNIEQLKNSWISAGQKVSDIQANLQMAVNDDSVTADKIKEMKASLENAKAKRDLAKEQLEEAEANAVLTPATPNAQVIVPVKPSKEEVHAKFIKDFKGMIVGDPQIKMLLSETLDGNGNGVGLTVPQDIQTAIRLLKRSYDSLEEYVRVEPVTTLTGSRVIEKWQDITPLANLDDTTAAIGANDDPLLTLIKYNIHRYAGLNYLTNSLLKDTAENIMAYLTTWLAHKSMVTRNQKIISLLDTIPAAQKKAITKIDDIKAIYNAQLDPAIQVSSIFITNQSGFNVLDTVKDAYGRYLIQPSPTDPSQKTLFGKPVKVLSDKFLPAEAGNFPLYIGDLTQAITLFDREQMSLATTQEGAGAFEHDQTVVRVIDRFDVQFADTNAIVFAQFTALAD
jgi:HK97 family phage major capsid protein